MSKTTPRVGHLHGDGSETVRQRVRDADDATAPAESTVYQMLALVSEYDATRLDELAGACRRGDEAWTDAVEEYAAFFEALASAQPRSDRD